MTALAGIIPAAGYSTRMGRVSKALIRVGARTMLERAADLFFRAGITEITVVTGHQADQVRAHALALGLAVEHNPAFARGMFSSVQTGLTALRRKGKFAGALILPVDAALTLARTARSLAEAWSGSPAIHNAPAPIVIPVFLGRCGHPLLLPASHFEAVLHWEGEYGLRGYIAALLSSPGATDFLNGRQPAAPGTGEVCFCPQPDAGVLSDLDTPERLRKAESFLHETRNRRYPSLEEAWHLLLQSGLSQRKILHSILVGLGAHRLCRALPLSAHTPPPLACLTAGLVHDMAKKHPDHAARGEELLRAMGWPETALAVGSHTSLGQAFCRRLGIRPTQESPPGPDIPPESEEFQVGCLMSACVYMADKYAAGYDLVRLEERFAQVKALFRKDAGALKAIQSRQEVSEALEAWFQNALNKRPVEVAGAPLRDEGEKRLRRLAGNTPFAPLLETPWLLPSCF